MSGLVTSQVAPELKERLDFYLAEISTEKRADKNFRKAYHFFIKEEHDSTIVYSGRYLKSKEKYSPLVSFALYFRGRSFSFKGLNKQSKNDLMRINSSFPLYNSVKVEIGNAHFKDQNYSKALEIYLEVSNDGDFQKKGVLESALNNNIGLSFMLSNDLVKAEEYLLLSLDQMKGSNDTSRIVDGYISVANLYYEQYLDDQAIEYFQKAYDLASETRDYPLRMTATLNMAVVEENRGDFEKSLAYRKEYDQWKDSTNNQEKVWEIAQIEKRHLAETKQKEIALLQNKKRLAERESNLKSQERNAILIGAGVLLAVLVLIIYFYYQKIRSSAIIAEQRESLDRLNGFKNRLFSIVSHDLRSSVHGLRRSTEQLRAEIPEEDSRLKSLVNQQGAIANSTYGMLDNLLNWALLQSDEIYFHPEKISLKRLIPQVVMNYQPLLDQKNISLAIDIPVEAKILADNDSVKIVLRNVLDNAMKFTPEKGVLKISAIVEEECVELRIKDNGPGMAPEQLTKVIEQSARVSKESGAERSGTGLGVRLCASFMSKNNGSFHIESEVDEGTTVILRFEKS
ncbi:MAG: ATP-binding protein [Fluviicola sp.]